VRLVIFHYHFLPGGVSQVITSSSVAILKYLPEIEEIILVSGKKDNTDNIVSAIASKISSTKRKAQIRGAIVPEIGYTTDLKKIPSVKDLKQIVNKQFKGCLWWIHNYHLGKNPIFTEAILQIAEENSEQKIILQIHDFPEASRYGNMSNLYRNIKHPLYPISPNIKYITINSRDYKFLIAAGIPKEIVFLLNNPVEPQYIDNDIKKKGLDKKKIDRILGKASTAYIKEAPLLIYPIRTIRRKNVLEAGLLAKCSRMPVNLIPTLPGISKSEKPYSELVASCFSEGLIPGSAQAGIILEKKGLSFPDIINAGSVIISSSVQEGFGYLFINSLLWEKPLLARQLDIINDFKSIFNPNFSHFYNNVKIPLRSKLRKQLSDDYDKKITKLKLILPADIVLKLKDDKYNLLKKNTIDFSFLSPIMQKKFFESLKDRQLLKETCHLNSNIIGQMERMLLLDEFKFDNTKIDRFNLVNHAKQIQKIITSPPPEIIRKPINDTNSIHNNILSYFADFPSISLLYDPI